MAVVPNATQRFIAGQIILGAITYVFAVTGRPLDKEGIDQALRDRGRADLIEIIPEPGEEG